MDTSDLKESARRIFEKVLRAVDAGDAIRQSVKLSAVENRFEIGGEKFDLMVFDNIYAIAIGKAALPMAIALEEVFGEKISGGIVSGVLPDSENIKLSDRWQLFAGGHPLPNESSIKAAQNCLKMLNSADDEKSLVIFLISGGGSAMLELPVSDHITLKNLQSANEILVKCGAPIEEINYLRRAFSQVKGGGLAQAAARAAQISLLISDTQAGDEKSIASGLTFENQPINQEKLRGLVEKYRLDRTLPPAVLSALYSENRSEKKNTKSIGLRRHYILLDNRSALKAAQIFAEEKGFRAEIVAEIESQIVTEGCRMTVEKLREALSRSGKKQSVALISGGEFACPVRGAGIGGRNSETVLQMAIMLDALKNEFPEVAFLSAGTDGIDGSSPAAGAVCDTRTLEYARLLGLDARKFLENSDSYSFFDSLGATVLTGATLTNVRDLRLLLARK